MYSHGIIVPHFGASQIANKSINLINTVENGIMFFEQLWSPHIGIKCATMCVNELMSFRGVLVTSNIKNTMLASNLVNRKKVRIIFFVWDLEWLRPNKQDYLYNIGAYNTPDVLVCEKDHVAPLYNYSNRKPISKDFIEVFQC